MRTPAFSATSSNRTGAKAAASPEPEDGPEPAEGEPRANTATRQSEATLASSLMGPAATGRVTSFCPRRGRRTFYSMVKSMLRDAAAAVLRSTATMRSS